MASMSGKENARIFVGGFSWETTEQQLDTVFSRFGKVLDVQDELLGCYDILSWITPQSKFSSKVES